MYLKKKYKKIQKKIILCCLISFLGSFYSEQAIAGDGLYQEGDNLIKALHQELIKNSVCKNIEACEDMLNINRADGKKIHLNMYEQTDTTLSSYVADFCIKKGIIITNEKPIILKIFNKPQSEYLGFKYAFGNNEYIIKLEINE